MKIGLEELCCRLSTLRAYQSNDHNVECRHWALASERFDKAVSVGRCLHDFSWVQHRQYLEAMCTFVVAAPCTSGGLSKSIENILLGHIFNFWVPRKRLTAKACAEERFERLHVGKKPRLHDLHHEMALAVGCICWTIPVVVAFEVLPCALRSDRSFGIQKENGRQTLTQIRTECSVSVAARATGLNLYRALWNPSLGEKRTKCPAAFAVDRFASSPFNVDFGLHHRLPPNRPRVQSSPSL